MVIKRGKYWHTDFPFEGRRVRKCTNETSKMAAQEAANVMLRNLQQGKKAKVKPVPTLEDFAVQTFLPYVEGHTRIKQKTKDFYLYGWSMLSGQFIAEQRLNQIKAPHLDMIQVEGSASRHNCALRTLSRMLNIARELEVITTHPRMKRHLLQEVERDKLPEDVEQKMATVFERSKRQGSLSTGFYLILDAGMRPFEVAGIEIQRIDLAGGKIQVPDSKTKAGIRYVPITERLREKLLLQIGGRASGWLFPSPRYRGQHIQRQALTRAWRIVANKAGVSADVDLYCARHSFGTDVMEATKNQFQLMKVMGHGDVSTTARYQHHETAQVGRQLEEVRAQRHNLRHNLQNSLEAVS